MHIRKPVSPNFGGIAKIQFCPVHLVEAVEIGSEATVTFREGGEWFDFYFTPESAAAAADLEDNVADPVFKAEVSLRVPADTSILGRQMESMAQYRFFLLRVVDQNKVVRLYGTKENPMELNPKFSTGAKVRDLRHRQVSFQGMLQEFPPICL